MHRIITICLLGLDLGILRYEVNNLYDQAQSSLSMQLHRSIRQKIEIHDKGSALKDR